MNTSWMRAVPLVVVLVACGADSDLPSGTVQGRSSAAGTGAIVVTPAPSATGGARASAVSAAGSGAAASGVPSAARPGVVPGLGAGGSVAPPSAGTTARPIAAAAGGMVAAASGGVSGSGPEPMAGMGMQVPIVTMGTCTPPPTGAAVSDYGAKGPFDTMTVNNTGPGNQFTLFRPSSLGKDGFVHPPVTWGNGVSTTPDLYDALLNTVASHGFVVIASNSTGITAADVRSGIEWLIMQNDMAGDYQGKLAVKCAGAIGYSMGGGAAVGAAAHPNVIATVSMHGLQGDAKQLHGPLLLMTSTNDGFVTKEGFVKPTYDGSTVVPTIMATQEVAGTPDFNGHLIPLGDSGALRAPLIAWLRLFIYGDNAAKPWFYGDDCLLCKAPWTDIQRKNGMW